ncbi:MAG TPA: Hint domain-containing protein, partial [Kofleriaceae bacterium]|nr:Hint domain-containing protein [Kofleriaceae bacterium]
MTRTVRACLLLLAASALACSGDDDGDSCFAAGTPVATPGGEVPIETLETGDPVLSLDRASGAVV